MITKVTLFALILIPAIFFNQILAQRTCNVERMITQKGLQQDYRILKDIIESGHPGLYLYQTTESINQIFDLYYSKINKDLNELEFYKLLVQMLDSIHCGHTFAELSPEFYDYLYSKQLIPFDVEIIDNRIFVKKYWLNSSDLKSGTEILSINGFPVKQIIDSISPSISADGYQRNYKLYRMALHFRLHFAKYFEQTNQFRIAILKPGQLVPEKVVIPSIFWDEIKKQDTLPTPKPLQFEIIDSLNTGILTIRSFAMGYISLFGMDYEAFYKDVFRQMFSKNIRNFVIDVRGNDVGNPEVYIPLLKYLMDKPFNINKKCIIKTQEFSKNLFKYSDIPRKYKTKWLSTFTEYENGEVLVKPTDNFIATLTHQPENIVFHGELYLLTDAGSYSAASVVPSFLKSNRKVTIFGEETGGTAWGNSSGITPTVVLPNSKLKINIPLATTYLNVRNDLKEGGVIPDYSVSKRQGDFCNNRDRQLEYLLAYIRCSNSSSTDSCFDIYRKNNSDTCSCESKSTDYFPFTFNKIDEIKIDTTSNNPFQLMVEENKIYHQLESLFDSLSRNFSFNGNVLIAKNGDVLYQSQFGFADFKKEEKLNKYTAFNLASISKQFTALAISILVEEEKLKFSDSIVKYLPEIPYNNITISQLLNHTSGIPDFYNFMDKYWDKAQIATNKDILKILLKSNIKLDFKPGENYKYSNTGYVLLALIIENVSRITYGDFMKSRIFDPVGMKNTWVKNRNVENCTLKNIARNHIISLEHGFVFPPKSDKYSFLNYLDETVGDGNIFSCIEDLFNYDNALNSGIIVSDSTLRDIFTPGQLQNGDTLNIELKGQSYAYGWRIRNSQVGKIIWHSGHLPGLSNLYVKNLENNITIFILSNNGFEMYKLYDKILEIITGVKMEKSKIFGDIALKNLLSQGSVSHLRSKFVLLTTNNDIIFGESLLNEIGYELISLNRYEDALEVFSLNSEKFPGSANVYDSMGEINLLLGNVDVAVENYKHALQIDSAYDNAEMARTIVNKIIKNYR